MKLPKTFIPDKDLEEKILGLKSEHKKRTYLNDIILNKKKGFPGFVGCYELKSLDEFYSALDKRKIVDSVFVQYDVPFVNIIEFEDEKSLQNSIAKMASCVTKMEKELMPFIVDMLTKEAYAVFVFTPELYFEYKDKFIDSYKDMGFVEVSKRNT
ncbi:hypothetical protein FJZ53_02205 [Candidatus Woesearchaeota archaeon]|nr:hypothetical protein [Candidatus Woesearchaeota archaeon]